MPATAVSGLARTLALPVIVRPPLRPVINALFIDDQAEVLANRFDRVRSDPPVALGTLPLDEERVPIGVVVEATLDVKPRLELLARLRVVDAGDKVVDPLFDGAVHLV